MRAFLLVIVCLLVVGMAHPAGAIPEDPWLSMQDFFPPQTKSKELSVNPQEVRSVEDPWLELQEYFIPFTEQQELEALSSQQRAVAIAGKLHKRLYPFRAYIAKASQLFRIPPEIIGAVIMVESSGNPRAKAPTSSAKGLMQTIDATFARARQALSRDGLEVADSAYNIKASIMTGSWYLGRMYDQAVADGRLESSGRDSIAAWKLPCEYYYAGPGHGKKKRDVVITYAGGKKVVIDKPAYSQKVLRWATIMTAATKKIRLDREKSRNED